MPDTRGIPVWFRFADIDIRATCECGWTATGDAASDAFAAWWKHRHDAHPDPDRNPPQPNGAPS